MPAGLHVDRPEGGFYVWLTLPEGLDAKVMQPRGIAERVAYVPGIGFYADGSGAGDAAVVLLPAPRTGSGKASAGSPAWSSRSWSCAQTFLGPTPTAKVRWPTAVRPARSWRERGWVELDRASSWPGDWPTSGRSRCTPAAGCARR